MQNAYQLSERLTVNQVAQHLNVHAATVYRWTFQGVRGKRLRSFLIGGRRTSPLPIWNISYALMIVLN